ncbi:unnamed protein product [Hydatigera taeniaeformis]|uniref:Testicular haploid expressed gene protein-like n=1 Tax=Hydatigena taeniaeformis TaxID=6205 RepID=A0A0R3WI15_HYDTA|nr:unnamed protein product [Hydatigera taeniaeformis]
MPHRLKKLHRHFKDKYTNARKSSENTTSWREEAFTDFTHSRPSDWIVSTPSETESGEARRISRFQLPPETEDWSKSRLVPNFPSDEDGYRGFGLISSRDSEPQDDYKGLDHRTARRENVELTPTQILRRWTTIVNLSGLKREGEKITVTPEAANDTEALHAAAHYMTEKFGPSAGTYEKWRQWFLPVCHPVRRRQNILKRFEIEYRVNVQDYEPAMRPIAKLIRRNIRQLLHKEYAPLNNRIWHEKLGQLLIQQSRVDLTDHMKKLEEREKQRQMELLQKGIIKQDIYDQITTKKPIVKHKVRRPKSPKRGSPTATNLLAHLDLFNNEAVAPNLDQLKVAVTSQQAALKKNELTSDRDIETSITPQLLQEWKAMFPSRTPKHKILIPLENKFQRDLSLLDEPIEAVKGEVASDERRWEDWVTNEEVSSQDSGRIHEDQPTPPTPTVRLKSVKK